MTHESSSSPAYDELAELFAASHLGRPPVPLVLRQSVEKREPWFYASRDMEPGFMYGFREYLDEALTGHVENYVAVSHAGHGVNSYAINYHLVYGRLAVFAQTGWGGAYSDKAADAARVAAQMERIERLVTAYESHAAAELIPAPPERLVVVESDLRGVGICGWLPGPLNPDDASDWLHAPGDASLPPTEAALDALAHRRVPRSGPN